MHKIALGIAVIAGLGFAGAAPASAQTAPYYPWCAHYGGDDMGSAIACGFMTYGQCMASVSGVGGSCQQNALPPPPEPTARATRKRGRR